ncbi:hypothetical protein JG688_00008794 [Phytophthora aleatoria]|uniref:Uncharacterized protein n=1 Tax=Phytophthora aleatoria TaxID=2496075 RepID=A0A8J5IUI3_9STRA|nr:hypothetical protein JG688_00008794 [Phytophthora aleatoria]
MSQLFSSQEVQDIKTYLGDLVDREADASAQVDARAAETAFWDRVRSHLVVNALSSGEDQLDRVVQRFIDRNGPDELMPAADPTAGAAAAGAASSSTSRPSKGMKPRKRAAPAIKNRAMASPKKRKTPAHSSGKKISSASDANPLTLVIITSAKSERSYVCPNDYDYNFVIPKHLVIKLDAVVGAKKMKRKGSDYFGNDSESDHPEDVHASGDDRSIITGKDCYNVLFGEDRTGIDALSVYSRWWHTSDSGMKPTGSWKMNTKLKDIEIRTSCAAFDSLATPETPETPKDGFKSPMLEEEELTPQGASFLELLAISMPQLGDALGDVGSGKPGEETDRKWTALLTIFFYLWMDITVNIAQTPALLLISDFAGTRQTIGSAMGQGWSTLGAIVVAAYTEFFGAAYNSMHWFLGMLSVFMAVCIGASCYVAKEIPLDKRAMEKRSCCKNVTYAFGSIYAAVKTLPGVLVVYCTVIFLNQYAFAAYNGNKGMFFGLEVFDGDATNSATCGDECSEEQRDYNRGVRLAGGLADMLFCIVGYVYSWVLPPLVRRFGAQKIATLATIPQVLLMFMAFCDIAALDVVIVALTSITISTFFALVVPLIVHIFGHTADIGVYVGVVNSANSLGQLLNFIVGSALVETSMGYRLPVFVGGAVSLLAFLVCLIFFRIEMKSM